MMLTQRNLIDLVFMIEFFKKLPASTTTTQYKNIIGSMDIFMEQDHKFSRFCIQQIYITSEVRDMQLKTVIAIYFGHFIENRLLLRLKEYEGGGDLTAVVNSWCNLFRQIVEKPNEDQQFFKEKFVDIFSRTLLELNDHSFDEVNRLLQSLKFYLNKRRIAIGFYFVKALFHNPKLTILPNNKPGSYKRFKYYQILHEITSLLIDQVNLLLTNLCDHHTNKKMIQIVMGLELLRDGMEFQLSPYSRKCLSTNSSLERILKEGWHLCKKVFYNNNSDDHEQLNKISHNILQIGIKIFQFSKLDPSINITTHQLLKITSQLYHIIIQQNPIITQAQDTTDQSIFYVNSTAISLILLSIDVSTLMNSKSDGQKVMEFKGETQYVFQVLLQPIFAGFKYLFEKVHRCEESTQYFVRMFLVAVFEDKQLSTDESCLEIESMDEPLLIAYIRLLKKLCQSFPELRSTIKTYLRQNMQSPPPQNPTQSETKTLINCLTLNSCFCQMLSSDTNWIILMQNLPYRAHTYLTSCQIMGSRSENLINCLYLLNIRVYIDDIIIQANSDCGLIKYLIDQVCRADSSPSSNSLFVHLCINVIQKYYKTYQFPYQAEQNNIDLLLNSHPNKIIIPLQLTILEFYKQLPLELCLKYVQGLRTSNMNLRVLMNICKKIDNIFRQFLKNQNRLDDDRYRYLQQNILLSFEMFDTILKISVHVLNQSGRSQKATILSELVKIQKQSEIINNQIIRSSVAMVNSFRSNQQQESSEIRSPYFLIFQLEQMIKSINSPPHTDFQRQLNPIFLLMQFLPKCEPELVVKLWRVCVHYLQEKGSTGDFQMVCKIAIVLQNIVEKLGQLLNQQDIFALLRVIQKHANRKNKIIATDKTYLYRGKFYTLFIMLLKLYPENIGCYLNSLQFDGMQQNFHPLTTAQTYKNILVQIFFTARNYAPLYDLSLVISYVSSLLTQGLDPTQSYKQNHSKYLHMYLKLLIESVERLHIWQENNQQEQHTPMIKKQQQSQIDHVNMEIDSCCRFVQEIVHQAAQSGWKVHTVEESMIQFIKIFNILKKNKAAWVGDIIKKFIKQETMENVQKIYSKYSHTQPKQRYKNRIIISVKKQQ